MKNRIAINTLAFYGYPLETAAEEIAKLGVGFIEPVYIAKYSPELKEEYFTDNNARDFLLQAQNLGLKIRSVASHMDMSLPGAVDTFRKRMKFAKNLGAEIIITNTSHIENAPQFYKNMQVLSGTAEEMKLIIGLENPGDGQGYIMNNATDGVTMLEKIGSDRIKLNYDFSNIHSLYKAEKTYEEGLNKAIPYMAHLHLKNIKDKNGRWPVCGLSEGIINYKQLFIQFPELAKLPMSMELPVRFGYNEKFEFVRFDKEKVPSLASIRKVLNESLAYMNDVLPNDKR